MLVTHQFSFKWTRLDSAPSPSPDAAHSGPIPIPGPAIPGQFRVQEKLDSSPELSPSPDSGVTALPFAMQILLTVMLAAICMGLGVKTNYSVPI